MVLLLQTFNKLCSKLENHHNRHGYKSSISVSHLTFFESEVSSCLNQLSLSTSKTLSFQWLLQLLQALPILNRAFAKLAVELGYPIEKWSPDLIDGYLNYTLNLLDLLNSISLSLSKLDQSRLSLSCALFSMAVSRLEPISPTRGNFEGFFKGNVRDRKKGCCAGEELAIGKALATMEGIGYWVCGIVISGCEGDSTAYFEMRKLAAGVAVPAFKALDLGIFAVVSGEGSVTEEVEEVNGAVAEIVVGGGGDDGEVAEETRRSLWRLEKAVEGLGKEVDGRFWEVLDGRSRLLDIFRQL